MERSCFITRLIKDITCIRWWNLKMLCREEVKLGLTPLRSHRI
ncbi:MAG: hypothetical protein JWQ30_643 [Sediminibacterium sp.]|nr:hypothetical protein [Sediminibacterium sp.]